MQEPLTSEHAQISTLGTVLAFWNNVELVMEMVIKQELGLTTEQACIVCGALGGGAKLAMLSSLVAEKGHRQSFVQAIRDFQGMVGRNALAHGFMTIHGPSGDYEIVSRDVKNKLSVRRRRLVDYYTDDFVPAYEKAITESGFSENEMYDYGREIAALAPDP
ncbi:MULTISPECIES: hypothetical protein [unclassified Sphingopyxis]|jgi:hypothetical protein|uniref:hypothetical protein n=1 Tax=unclassified Sphingopyxis TaxID=2614943 RepID=UPI0025EA070B|nr:MULTISPECIES: hypothetical protein [unclassified Sphingopyxis]